MDTASLKEKGVHWSCPHLVDSLPLGNWGEFSMRCEESTFRCSSPQQRVENSAATRFFHAARFGLTALLRSNEMGDSYPSAECRRCGLYHPSMKSKTRIFASA